jgi:hypothetical protein
MKTFTLLFLLSLTLAIPALSVSAKSALAPDPMINYDAETNGSQPSSTSRALETAKKSNDALKENLVKLEKESWEAWKNRDGKFFQRFLSDDHVEVGFGGITNKATVVAGVSSKICEVKSYAVDRFELHKFDAKTALLTYHAAQDTRCAGNAVPSPVWVSSLYVKRGNRWVNAFYQQTQTRK